MVVSPSQDEIKPKTHYLKFWVMMLLAVVY